MRQRLLKSLRIAVTAALLLACGLLIVLWVPSFDSRAPTTQELPQTTADLLLRAGIKESELSTCEFVDDGISGWWAGIHANPSILPFFEQNWTHIDQLPPGYSTDVKHFLSEWMPSRWRFIEALPSTKIFMHPDFDPSEERESLLACFSVEDQYLLVWCYKNF